MKLSILIPAYNEEKNIENIINSILEQKIDTCSLEKIIVAISGTDNTKKLVESFHNEKIEIWYTETRKPKVYFENMFFALKTTSDILVGIDADCFLPNTMVLEKLISPFGNQPKLVCSNPLPVTPKKFIEKIGCFGDNVWKNIRDSIRHKSPVHDCNGRLFAISTSVANQITIPFTPGDDMYIACKTQVLHYPIVFVEQAQILYKLPGNLKDYIRQHMRYDKQTMKEYFPKETLTRFTISPFVICKTLLINCSKSPLIGLSYCILRVSIKCYSLFYSATPLWTVSQSTKKI
jgi:glycosyltransferase involved in cell wall biosynthesis